MQQFRCLPVRGVRIVDCEQEEELGSFICLCFLGENLAGLVLGLLISGASERHVLVCTLRRILCCVSVDVISALCVATEVGR